MTDLEVISMLKTLSLGIAPDHNPIGQKVPFATYSYTVTPYSASDTAYINRYAFMVRVFMSKLDQKIFKEIESKFLQNEIVWTRSEPIWIDDSNVFEIDYEFGTIGA